MRIFYYFILFIIYMTVSFKLFGNYWGLTASLIATFVILALLALVILFVYEKKFKKKPRVPFDKIVHQTENLESIIHELKSKSVNAEIQAVTDRLEEFIEDAKNSESLAQQHGLYEHILITCNNELEKTKILALQKEYSVVIHIVKELIYGKDCHTICENLLRYGDAFKSE